MLSQLLSVFLGTVPLGMMPLAIVLAVRAWTGSFAAARFANAAFTCGTAGGLIVQGATIDRFGAPVHVGVSVVVGALATGGAISLGPGERLPPLQRVLPRRPQGPAPRCAAPRSAPPARIAAARPGRHASCGVRADGSAYRGAEHRGAPDRHHQWDAVSGRCPARRAGGRRSRRGPRVRIDPMADIWLRPPGPGPFGELRGTPGRGGHDRPAVVGRVLLRRRRDGSRPDSGAPRHGDGEGGRSRRSQISGLRVAVGLGASSAGSALAGVGAPTLTSSATLALTAALLVAATLLGRVDLPLWHDEPADTCRLGTS